MNLSRCDTLWSKINRRTGEILPEGRKITPLVYLLPLSSGLTLILAFPPFEQGWLAWFALMPLLWFCLQAGPLQALCGGFLFGLPLQLYLNLYLSTVLFTHLSPLLAGTTLLLLIALLSLFYGLFALAVSCIRGLKSSLLLAAVIPSLWVLTEYLRSLGFIGYPVGYLGYTQWHYSPSLNLLSAFGYWGLSFIIVFFQTALLLGLSRRLGGGKLLAAAAIFLMLFCGGAILPELAAVEREAVPLQSALIQGCSSTGEILGSDKEIILQRYLHLTRAALAEEPGVELVLWPETVVALQMKEGVLQQRREMVRLAAELGVELLYGAQIYSGETVHNAIVLYSPEQGSTQIYHKQRLVPFVEYFPLEAWLNRWLDLDFNLGRYQAGEEHTLFSHRKGPFAGVICFESYFGDYTRHFARRGGRHLFIATNDVWFGESIGLEQHAQVAALRAAEMGIGVTQVANSGISISFDYRGRELMRTDKEERGFYLLPLDLARRPTLYRASGDFFLPLSLLLVLASVAAIAAGRRVRSPSQLPAASRHRKSR